MIEIKTFDDVILCQPLFPDLNAKIIGMESNKSFHVKMFENGLIDITPNSKDRPYVIGIKVPGTYFPCG